MPNAPSQRFNHVAFTVAPELLRDPSRGEILAFYDAVFGWKEVESQRIDGARLVLQCHLMDQFVYLVGGSPITTCVPFDHFGLAVGALQELEVIVRRADAYRAQDTRVEVFGHEIEEHGEARVHYAYIRYRLPMRIEIQYFELPAVGVGETSGSR